MLALISRCILDGPPSVPLVPSYLSFSKLRERLRQAAETDWDTTLFEGIPVHKTRRLFMSSGLPKDVSVSLSREAIHLITGHGVFAYWTATFDPLTDMCCRCEERAVQTSLHLLLDCELFGRERLLMMMESGWSGQAGDLLRLLKPENLSHFNNFTKKIVGFVEATSTRRERRFLTLTPDFATGARTPAEITQRLRNVETTPWEPMVRLTNSDYAYKDSFCATFSEAALPALLPY